MRHQSAAPGEIVVVVDHSRGLVARLARQHSDILAIENENGIGLSGARNTGLAAARNEIVAFLDDDATAARDWLERLAESYAYPAVVAVGGSAEPRWPRNTRPRWF